VSFLLDTSVISELVRKNPHLPLLAATRWGALAGESEKRGQPLPVIDSLIAATARAHGLAVVTRNVEDFKRCGVVCVNP
jgi:toxin FitB